jgi:hypothetical protein
MRGKGISYDTGFFNQGVSTHEPFDSEVVRREMAIIRDDLHCNAVRVTGGDPDRLEIAARHAAEAGLEVWFSPFTCDLTTEEMLAVLADCAGRAERLRREGAEVVLVTGAELSLVNAGFLPGATLADRLDLLTTPQARLPALIAQVPARLDDFLGRAVTVVRARFGGRITYASIPFEAVNWAPFDLVSVDAYRSIEIADRYRDAIRALVAQGKPVAITEFGCATYKGAADKGARGGMIVEWDETITPLQLDGDYTRDETEQVTYLRELLGIFEDEGVDTAFVYTFANYHLPHRHGRRDDLDMASYGVVKVLQDRLGGTYPDMAWEPKPAFSALADHYSG